MKCTAVMVILNYNDMKVTEKLVRSVVEFECPERVVVVDNCSTDGSFEYLNSSINKTDADGRVIGTSYWERVEIGMEDFLRLIQDYVEQKNVDWRYCLTFLSTQFEGLLRDVITKLGGATTRIKKERDTELIPLEGLLRMECLTKVFSEDDLFMFKMAFTKDGYNIRNDVAHGMLLPQEYNPMRAMLVFVSIIRLSKATSYIVENNN